MKAFVLLLVGLGLLAGCSMAMRPRMAAESGSALAPPTPAPATIPLSDLVPAQSLPARGEELWIIEKPDAAGTTGASDQLPRGASMLASVRGTPLPQLPLLHTDVRAHLIGAIASVDVHQQFSNPSQEVAEASYAFPLPLSAAVSEFVMTVGKRHIRGIVRERAEAEEIYRQARGQGFLAALVVQRSPQMFVQHVANLEPGQRIDVEIRYFQTLAYRDGWFEFAFPLAVEKGTGAAPGQRSGRDVSVAVRVDPGMAVERVESPTHPLEVRFTGNTVAEASLAPGDRIANRDLVIRYKVAGDGVKTSLITEGNVEGGTFSLLLVPPLSGKELPRMPLDLVLALDPDAGPAASAEAAALLRLLSPQDTFQIVRAVPGSAQALAPAPLQATPENVVRFVDALSTLTLADAPGAEVLRTALMQPRTGDGMRIVCLLTDGHAGVRDHVGIISESLGAARIVAIGVGASPDREAIDAIAHCGRGAAAYLMPGQNAVPILSELLENLRHPALTDIELDWQGAGVSDILPRPTPDLFCGHAVTLIGRYRGPVRPSLIIRGKVANEIKTWKISAEELPPLPGRSPLACIWARRQIASLVCDAATHPSAQLGRQIRDIALEYGLISGYTAFITVDATNRTGN
jgi:Ca-activated chloride channel family protein